MPAEKWTVVVVLYKQNYKQSSHRVGHEVVVHHWTWHARCVINDEAGQISLVNIKHLVRLSRATKFRTTLNTEVRITAAPHVCNFFSKSYCLGRFFGTRSVDKGQYLGRYSRIRLIVN